MTDPTEITLLLDRIGSGDDDAWNELLPRLYSTLHEIAHRMMQDQAEQRSLQTTVLVHEAFLKMVGGDKRWETRRHFERVAACAMRSVLVDHARARNARKRSDGRERVLLTEEVAAVAGPRLDILALNEAMGKLQELDPDTAEVAELRCFGGLEHEAIARVTGKSRRTVVRAWRFARSWLERELEDRDD